MKITTYELEYLEFAVTNLEQASLVFSQLGFDRIGMRENLEQGIQSVLFSQNQIQVILTQSTISKGPIFDFVSAHGNSLWNIAFRCKDAIAAFEFAVNQGAKIADPPKSFTTDFGSVHEASILMYDGVRHSFVSREGTVFGIGFHFPYIPSQPKLGLTEVKAIAICVQEEEVLHWKELYEKIFLSTGSSVLGNAVKRIEVIFNENKKELTGGERGEISPQEFLEIHHGAGIQTIVVASNPLEHMIEKMKAEEIHFTVFLDQHRVQVKKIMGVLDLEIFEEKKQ